MASDQQKVELVQSTWPKISVDSLADHFYKQFFQLDREAIPLFGKTDMHMQGAQLIAMMSTIVSKLSDMRTLNSLLHSLASKHVKFNVPLKHYDTFGKAWLITIETSLIERSMWVEEVKTAWYWAMETIIGAMKKALYEESSKSVASKSITQESTAKSGAAQYSYSYTSDAYGSAYSSSLYNTTSPKIASADTYGQSAGSGDSKSSPYTYTSSPYKYKPNDLHDFNAHFDSLDKFLDQFPIFGTLEAKTGVRRSFIAIGLMAAVITTLLSSHGPDLICNIFGFAYPTYATFKTLRREEGFSEGDFWLSYWVVFGGFTIFENIFDAYFLQSWGWLYLAFKCLFLFWAFLPQTRGAALLYQKLAAPLTRYEKNIDSFVIGGERLLGDFKVK